MAGREHSSRVSERFLRQLWKHQQFTTAQLHTSDGRDLDILSPGTVNGDGGPDFRGALIRIGGTMFRGDIELHNSVEEWTAHGHHTDGHYGGVILHVVLSRSHREMPSTLTTSSRDVPLLILSPVLGRTFREVWDMMILDERSERRRTLPCHNRTTEIDTGVIRHWLEHLSTERMEIKLRRFEERLKELIEENRRSVREPVPDYREIPYGIDPDELPLPVATFVPSDFSKVRLWEQVLFEGILEALGYSKNRPPFLKLARNLPLRKLSDIREGVPSEPAIDLFEAFLFGAAGLLPDRKAVADSRAKERPRRLLDLWHTHRSHYRNEVLHEAEWQFFRLRPENFPTLRIAGAARLALTIIDGSLFRTIISIIGSEKESQKKKRELIDLFIVKSDLFWSSHYTFRSEAQAPLHTLVGRSRGADIVLNTVIPLALLYARIFKLREIREKALALYNGLPASGGNSIINLIMGQVLKNSYPVGFAWEHQGVLQLHNFYCSEGRCAECTIGAKLGLSASCPAGTKALH